MNFAENIKEDKSAFFLLVSNIATIAMAVALNWSLIVLLWGYWLQSVIIGFFNFFKILTLKNFSTENFKVNGSSVEPTRAIKLFTAFFFAFHYGMFHFVYAIFLGVFSSAGLFSGKATLLDFFYVLLMGAIFFASHLFSFFYNKKAEKIENIGKIMFSPYARIIPMHLTIILGGFLIGSVGRIGEKIILVFFMLLKTAADLAMHFAENKKKISQQQISAFEIK